MSTPPQSLPSTESVPESSKKKRAKKVSDQNKKSVKDESASQKSSKSKVATSEPSSKTDMQSGATSQKSSVIKVVSQDHSSKVSIKSTATADAASPKISSSKALPQRTQSLTESKKSITQETKDDTTVIGYEKTSILPIKAKTTSFTDFINYDPMFEQLVKKLEQEDQVLSGKSSIHKYLDYDPTYQSSISCLPREGVSQSQRLITEINKFADTDIQPKSDSFIKQKPWVIKPDIHKITAEEVPTSDKPTKHVCIKIKQSPDPRRRNYGAKPTCKVKSKKEIEGHIGLTYKLNMRHSFYSISDEIFCLKCRKKTKTKDIFITNTETAMFIGGSCVQCNFQKGRIICGLGEGKQPKVMKRKKVEVIEEQPKPAKSLIGKKAISVFGMPKKAASPSYKCYDKYGYDDRNYCNYYYPDVSYRPSSYYSERDQYNYYCMPRQEVGTYRNSDQYCPDNFYEDMCYYDTRQYSQPKDESKRRSCTCKKRKKPPLQAYNYNYNYDGPGYNNDYNYNINECNYNVDKYYYNDDECYYDTNRYYYDGSESSYDGGNFCCFRN